MASALFHPVPCRPPQGDAHSPAPSRAFRPLRTLSTECPFPAGPALENKDTFLTGLSLSAFQGGAGLSFPSAHLGDSSYKLLGEHPSHTKSLRSCPGLLVHNLFYFFLTLSAPQLSPC